MDTPSAYIPADRRQALARREELPENAHGAALFADISGFTPLTDGLVRALGPQRGVEELLHRLNAVYDAVIAEVDRQRGSVIGFSGDAITCWFEGDDGRRAVACGLAQQQAMTQFAEIALPGSGSVALALKVAVAVGPARRFLVGDPRVQVVDVLAGTTLDIMAAEEHLAQKGEVLLDGTTARALGDRVEVLEWREGDDGMRCAVIGALREVVAVAPWPPLSPDALSDEQTRPWLLPPVYERLHSGQGEFLAELRPAVSLFMRFPGGDFDGDEQAAPRLNAYIQAVQHILARHEGSLIQITVGDKGCYLYAAFGAPIAHDDDPSRAVAAALDLRALGVSSPVDAAERAAPQIGISRGRMRVGASGSTTCRTYAVMGNETNMAARLMSRAEPGQILVSQRLAQAVERDADLLPLGPVKVKGRDEPLLVSSVVGWRQTRAGTRMGLLVGRDAELAQMSEVLERAMAGSGQLLRIEGAPGIGKSHLSATLVDAARARGLRVAQGASQSSVRDTAYTPWRQVMRALLDLVGAPPVGDDPSTTAAEIATLEAVIVRTNPDWLLRLPLLGDLLGLPIPDNPTTAAFDARLRRGALFDLVGDMIRSLSAQQPLLLVFDDVHAMDEASQGLLAALGRATIGDPVVLALAQRPAADRSLLPELDVLPGYHRLELNELGPAGIAALVAQRLGSDAAPLLLDLLQVETQGNPFFIDELIVTLRESGKVLRRDDGRWGLSGPMVAALRRAGCLVHRDGEWVLAPTASLADADLGLPDSIHGIVLARMDRLPEGPKLTLKVASVIGAVFGVDVVAQAHPLEPDAAVLTAQIDLLEARDFARVEEPPSLYAFRHNVTREVAYETLLYTQRRQLHRAVGEALERLDPDAVTALAHHFCTAEVWPEALRYQLLAGRQGQRLFTNFDAIEHFTRALASIAHLQQEDVTGTRQQIHAALGELLTTVGQYEQALDHLRQALDLARGLHDADAQAHSCRWIARLYELRGDYPAALEWIQEALAVLASRETVNRVEVLVTAGLIYTRQGDYDNALERGWDSLRIAEATADDAALGRAYALLGLVTWKRGNSTQALEYLHKGIELYGRASQIHGQAQLHNEIANAYLELGRWTEADRHYGQARAIFSQIGDVYHEALAQNNLGNISLRQGRLKDALGHYENGLRSLEQIGGSAYVVGCFEMNIGGAYVRSGDPVAAARHLQTSKDLYEQARARDFLPELHRLLAEAALLEGKVETARDEALLSLSIARDLAVRGEEGSTLRVLGQTALAAGQPAEAADHLRASLAIVTEIGDEYEEARGSVVMAVLLFARGDRQQGQRLLDRAEQTFRRLDAALDLAEARRLAAEQTASA